MKPAPRSSVAWAGGLERLGVDGVARILAMAGTEGTAAAMREAIARDPALVPAFRITGRADWRFVLPEHGHDRAVVLGSALGGTAFDLSEDYREVVSCERSPEGLEWQSRVLSAGTFGNVRVVGAPEGTVPLADGCADLVALERGFAQAGVPGAGIDARTIAGEAVREARRLLKDGGWLYWGVATRPGWPIPGSRGRGSAHGLFTPSEVASLLAREGLDDVVFYWVRPDLDNQHSSGWLGDRRTFVEHVRARRVRRATDALRHAGLKLAGKTNAYWRLLPQLAVFARRRPGSNGGSRARPASPPRPEFVHEVERLLGARGRRVEPLEAVLVQVNFNVSGRLTYRLFERGRPRPSYIVKLARNRKSTEALEAEARTFEALLARSEFLRSRRPRVYHRGERYAFVLEDFLVGTTLAVRQGDPDLEARAFDWLEKFQSAAVGKPLGAGDLVKRLIRLGEATGSDRLGRLVADVVRRVEAMGPFEVPEVPVHGDFTDDNILLDGDDVYVVDWEWLRLGGWPLDDLWWFLIVGARGIPGTFTGSGSDRVLDVLTGRAPQAARMRDVARRFASTRRGPEGLVPVFAIVMLLEMTLRWKDEGRIDWQTSSTADYEKALSGLAARQDEYWAWWEGR